MLTIMCFGDLCFNVINEYLIVIDNLIKSVFTFYDDKTLKAKNKT